jgi:outer membrane protein assembly factor BamA
MAYGRITFTVCTLLILSALLVSGTGCNTTQNLKEDQYLLRSNAIKLKSNVKLTQKGELKDNLSALVVQKPNSYIAGIIPFKLWLYNSRYKKYQADTSNFQLKSRTVEAPVIYDSASNRKSVVNMKGYLFHEGYFYSKVTDTTTFSDKKAYVTYKVETGTNYLINNIYTDINDSTVASFVLQSLTETTLKKNTEFSYSLLEEERSRITGIMRNLGFYKFSNENINFELDTMNKQFSRDAENPFESAINFIALQKNEKKPTLDIKIIIRADDDPSAYYRYGVNRVRVFPDYIGRSDFRDTSLVQDTVQGVIFRYREKDFYIRQNVIVKHMFIEPEKYFSQSGYDLTITKLNELGVFQSVRITFTEDTIRHGHWLNCNVFLNPGQKFDFNTTLEGSNGGSIYAAGSALTMTFRDRNLGKGANLLTTSISAGLELNYNDTIGSNVFEHFRLQTRNLGASASIDFPKFLSPFNLNFSRRNAPRTIIGAGISLQERVNYFTLITTSTNLTYKWRETSTKNWEFSPAFVNIIRTPYLSPSFQLRLDSNSFLKNTYRETFIEGENVAFIFTNREERKGRDYWYARIGFEEAGGIVKLVNSAFKGLDSTYAQYVKFDFDVQRFYLRRHSTVAFRLYGGVGIPYDKSSTLPYIKQYNVGGAYSIRGYRIRRLGPGSYFDIAASNQTNAIIDRTGDIKLEMNGEYRFDMVQMFSGAIGLKGALFADAGNIWLFDESNEFPEGQFEFGNKLLQDIAISVGTGVRFDVAGFFLVRLDLGMPVKNPNWDSAYTNRGGWVLDKIDFGDKTWRRENLVLSFAVGYPF